MCLKACFSAAFYFVCLLTLTNGFFLPVFVRKQHPQTALNSAQWASYQSTGLLPGLPSSSANGNVNVNSLNGNAIPNSQPAPTSAYKEYNPLQQPHGLMTPLHQVQMSQIQPQYSYESVTAPYQTGPYPQYHSSAFHSVQLVPCLCPISKDIIEQQTQQFQNSQPISSSSSSASSVESGNNEVLIKGNQKVSS